MGGVEMGGGDFDTRLAYGGAGFLYETLEAGGLVFLAEGYRRKVAMMPNGESTMLIRQDLHTTHVEQGYQVTGIRRGLLLAREVGFSSPQEIKSKDRVHFSHENDDPLVLRLWKLPLSLPER